MTSPAPSITTSPPTTRARSRSRAGSVSAPGLNGHTLAGIPGPVPPVPAPHATHSSFIPTRYIKHASLINNCYPVKPDEKGPKSSDLSYLVFYATSKPAKLTKVGNFIERRVVRDHRKKRLSDVHCSLEIIKTLLLASKAHLNIFSKNIIAILDTLLVDLTDIDVVRHCQDVFASFCGAHDGSTLGVDTEFRVLYDRVVDRFADIATFSGDNDLRYRLIGLRALEGVVSSSALYACDHKAQLSLVLPSILDALLDSKTELKVVLDPSQTSSAPRRSVSIHIAVHPDNIVTEEDVTAEALQCLRALFKTPNGVNVKLALEPTFAYLNENGDWWPSASAVSIIKAIVSSILPQYRYMVVNELLARVDRTDETTPDLTLRLQKKATLVAALQAILTSPIFLVGMPVLEVLHSLLTSLIKTLAVHPSDNESMTLVTLTREGLTKCIGGLATHIYYTNQVPHIISHLAGKLSIKLGVSPQPETIEGVPTTLYREAILGCLLDLMATHNSHQGQEANFHAAEISSDLLTPCLGLLLSQEAGLRSAFAQVLITFLTAEDQSHRSSAPAISSDLQFRAMAHQTLHAYARSPSLSPADMAVIGGIFEAMLTHFQDDEFMRAVPVMFSLQDWCMQSGAEGEEADPTSVVHKRAVATMVVSYFQTAVEKYGMAEPREYLENIKASREGESQWVPAGPLNSVQEQTWAAPSEPLLPILAHPLARDHLVTLLTTVSDQFRAGADRFGIIYNPEQISNSLTIHSGREVGSGLFLSSTSLNALGHKQERSMDSRIRVSRHLEDWALPKMMIPQISTSTSDLTTSEGTTAAITPREGSLAGDGAWEDGTQAHKKIGVDNLKSALAAARLASATDTTSDAGSMTSGSDSRVGSPASHRFYPLSVHAQALRKKQEAGAANSLASLSSSRPDLASLLNTIEIKETAGRGPALSMMSPPY